MGCSTSKLDNEEVVLLCKDRKRFIKQAVDQRYGLAAAHVAYIHSLKNIGIALRHFVGGGDDTLLDSSSVPTSPGTTPIFTPPVPTTPETVALPEQSSSPSTQSPAPPDSSSSPKISYLKASATPPMYVEERPSSPESVRMVSYSAVHHYGIDGFFGTDLPPAATPVMSSYSNNEPDYVPSPPSPPQNSSWDFFNPFTSLDNPYPYHDPRRLSQVSVEEDARQLRQVREEEGIPDLEDVHQQENGKEENKMEVHVGGRTAEAVSADSAETHMQTAKEQAATSEVAVESSVDALIKAPSEPSVEAVGEAKMEFVEELPSKITGLAGEAASEKAMEKVEERVSVEQNVKDKEVSSENTNFTSFVIRRPMNLLEAIKDIEDQFGRASDFGKEVSTMLEASKAQYTSSFGDIREHSAKVLSSFPLFRSSSSRSSSSRTPLPSSSSKDDSYDSCSDFAEECGMISGSHASTLDRLYAWEKKLYEEVKSGERIRMAYEKKCMQLRNQDAKGEDHRLVDKTRAEIKSLHTRIRVSIHAVESVSKRIEKLRDEELQPQLSEFLQGLMRMWKGMLECHQVQYQIMSDIKLQGSSSIGGISSDAHQRATIQLENELHGWHANFSSWIGYQKAYVQALNGWLSKCICLEPEGSSSGRVPFSPRKIGAPPVFIICSDWSRAFEKVPDKEVVNAIRSYAADVHALWEQQDEEQRQKRKAEYLGKDLDRRVATLQRVESRRHQRQFSSDGIQESGIGQPGTAMADRNMSIDSFRKRVEEEKAKHHKVMQDAQKATLESLQTGLTSIFDALPQFAKSSLQMYEKFHDHGEGKVSI